MDPIQKAIEDIDSREEGASFSYREVAKKYNISRATLARRHQGRTRPHSVAHNALHPQQEKELVQYIKGLSERRLPPTRTMIRNFASSLAGKDVSETWVTRFMARHPFELTSRYTSGMDRKRHKADSGAKYSLYFELLHAKMMEYRVQPTQIYNMDEKGFQIGSLGRSKRVFDKVLYD
ncbi:hypothetical protein PtrM4_123270 [Pyrenophora tritici-repentis]|uniref:HTH CENPB-type domain-containing protein n=1 Tax=Pyrenophora tritici-repentis TaxID=45151 RepID=A0A834RXJ5_9PLEO|nr:hypothetical protein PtrM4_123270 [Pyrenophora tritici-repentis]KAI1680349.1 Tc5 transposase DNA-binding domain containing protein [Pyrenophora tritici-repentis]